MNEVLLRIRKVFEESGLNQTEIANRIDKTPQYVWKMLNNDSSNPRKDVRKRICQAFSVRKEWLEYGDGEQYLDLTRNQQILKFSNEVMGDMDNSFKRRFFSALSKLDESDWEAIEKIIAKVSKED